MFVKMILYVIKESNSQQRDDELSSGHHLKHIIILIIFTCTSASGRDSKTIKRTPKGHEVFSKKSPSAS